MFPLFDLVSSGAAAEQLIRADRELAYLSSRTWMIPALRARRLNSGVGRLLNLLNAPNII